MNSAGRAVHGRPFRGRAARTCLLALSVFSLVAALGGCRFVTTRISDIQAKPADYLNREVTVAGSVTNAIKLPFLPGLYEVSDGSGVISVLTNTQPPLSGQRVRIRARVGSAATLGGQTVGLHLSELQRY
jgi:hypothetical protein